MEHRAPFRNSLLLTLFSVIFFGCDSQNDAVHAIARVLNKAEQNFSVQNGLMILNNKPFSGTVFTLFPGSKDTAELTRFLDGKEHGEWTKFYPSKRIREKRYFKNGQKTGEYIAWWENGNKQLDYFFSNDEYEGTCREWNETGMLTKVMNYKMGHEDGHQQWWYDNGKIKANYVIQDGRRYGLLGTKNCINVSDSIFKK